MRHRPQQWRFDKSEGPRAVTEIFHAFTLPPQDTARPQRSRAISSLALPQSFRRRTDRVDGRLGPQVTRFTADARLTAQG